MISVLSRKLRVLLAGVVAAGVGFAGVQTASAAGVQRMYDDNVCRGNGDYFRVFSDDHPSAPLCFTGHGSLDVAIYRVTKVESGAYRASVNADGPQLVTFEPGTLFTTWTNGRAKVTKVTLIASLQCPRGC
ncbi:hypothetical protein E1263_27795 [Kribbella antibiotica]|uniref:Streptomyces killer toxin-like beta/gamma crystallin domain-containing protein n=1 Tax=Kribbella antibiotica TaxID=190195 RepID=A0A4R4Z752_9ACTN|nr:hypothetical protein [Kribbella antibiotica]TDD53766.1 hypothetical protein E1263_27795 [Kribbella antibiotica]